MSDIVIVARPSARLSLRRRVLALAAVGYARHLARMKPGELEVRLRRISARARPAGVDETMHARDAITTVSTRCAGRWCLDRSIATALLLRADGMWPEWHAGVCLLPFRAHAWVSVNGEPVGEPAGLARSFQSLVTVKAFGR